MYYCDACRVFMDTESMFHQHIISERHNRISLERTDYEFCVENQCACGKIYVRQSYLLRHYKTCSMHNNVKKKREVENEKSDSYVRSR